MLSTTLLAATVSLALTACSQAASPDDVAVAAPWPQLRGPLGTGVAPAATPPIHWDETRNVRWRLVLEGLGHSSPVVANDRVFLTTAIPVGPKLEPQPETAPGAHDRTSSAMARKVGSRCSAMLPSYPAVL